MISVPCTSGCLNATGYYWLLEKFRGSGALLQTNSLCTHLLQGSHLSPLLVISICRPSPRSEYLLSFPLDLLTLTLRWCRAPQCDFLCALTSQYFHLASTLYLAVPILLDFLPKEKHFTFKVLNWWKTSVISMNFSRCQFWGVGESLGPPSSRE